MRRPLVVVTLMLAVVLAAAAVGRAAYPERPIKLIVPWAAGGDTDAIFRPFGQQLQKHLGQTVVIANVTGASGTAGAREAKAAPPDGYTLYAVHDSIHSAYYTGVADVAYTDFEPVCAVSSTPSVLAGSSKTKWSSWQELATDARARPRQISVGATLGSTSHFFPALIEKASGLKFKYVPYDWLAPRMNAILRGDIDLTDSTLTQKGKVDAGRLKFLAVATDQRLPDAPTVPTLRELGVDVVYAVTRGVMAPKGTPADVLAKLEDACRKATSEPKLAEDIARQGTFVRFLDRKGYAAFLEENDDLNRTLARELGLLKR
jgi:tripartite-type tricarboxylate transporter receptor subunit TctC